ncbi:MAG: GAF domain-containing protein, partial [Anaerolineae bacterium]|nr:GAF domain-containing protein [Anaerolineae bacterium]
TNDYYLPKLKINLKDMVGKTIDTLAGSALNYEVLTTEISKHGRIREMPMTLKQGNVEISLLLYAEKTIYADEACILISFVDITNQNNFANELARLYDATSYLFEASNVKDLAQSIVNGIVKEFNQVDCGLMLLDDSGEYLVRAARAGEYAILLEDKISVSGRGLVPQAFREGHPLYAWDVSQDESYVPNVPTTASEFVIPLKTNQGIIGVLDFQSQQLDGFSETDQRLLAVFSERASAALENMQLHDAVRTYAETLEDSVEERTRELTEALEKQRDLLRVKTRFVSMISHEYRTPLTVISSSASILQRYADRLDEEKKQHHLQKIQNQVRKLNGMLHDVLEVNRAETSGVKFTVEVIDAQETVANVIKDLQEQSPASVITLELDGTADHVKLDKRLFVLIVENLLSNAIKYSPTNEPIRCRLGYQENRLLIQVSDQGIGIPASEQENLFTTFYRASNVGQIPGTGLGLSIVRQSVEAHNGNLSFESEEGSGTTFTVTLPVE